MLSEQLRVAGEVAAVLDALRIPYAVGGSVASSMCGVPRFTQDIDLLASIQARDVDPLVGALHSAFFVDPESVRTSVRERQTFNIFHRVTAYKVDVFVADDDEWVAAELGRAIVEQFDDGGRAVPIRFSSPEDVILHKLVWYRLGEEVSDRPWSDVSGILSVQATNLDVEYVDRWARRLGVFDLLQRARKQTGKDACGQ